MRLTYTEFDFESILLSSNFTKELINKENNKEFISVVFRDRIKEFIIRKELVEIIFYNENWDQNSLLDFISKIDKTSLQLSKGNSILLSKLVSVDYKRPKTDSCGIDRKSNPCGDASDY